MELPFAYSDSLPGVMRVPHVTTTLEHGLPRRIRYAVDPAPCVTVTMFSCFIYLQAAARFGVATFKHVLTSDKISSAVTPDVPTRSAFGYAS
jgi:hypothetical protein